MNIALFSPAWYRVANLHVRLRKHTAIHRHHYRDRVWYVLQDRVTGQFHRFTPEAYEIIGRFDGQRTLQEIWDEVCAKLGDVMPTQSEVIGLVSQLYQANAIRTDAPVDVGDLDHRRRRTKRQNLLRRMMSPLGIRIPLFDPERFLESTNAYVSPVLSLWGLIVWLAVIVVAVVLAAVHWSELTANLADRVLALQNVFLMALVYPVVKSIHELGHAYAVKRWGGEVHEMGIMMLVFYPVPYVDASASSAFRSKWERAAVGAMGIMVEAFLAALALFVWLLAEPGVIRSLATNVMIISGVSTLVFNGNPLLRFDAYYVLADIIEIPNLAQRGNQQVGYLVKHHLMKVKDVQGPAWSRGEAAWLVFYAIASFIYRIAVLLLISLVVTARYMFFGVLIAFWSLYMSVFYPAFRMLLLPSTDPRLRPLRYRIYLIGGAAALTLAVVLFALPVPYSISAQGVVWVEDEGIVRVETAGFLTVLNARPGEMVRKGASLATLWDGQTDAHVAALSAEVEAARFGEQAAIDNPGQMVVLQENSKYLADQLAVAQQHQDDLTLKAKIAGRFLAPDPNDLVGRYFHRGERLGFIAEDKHMTIVVPVPDSDIAAVRSGRNVAKVHFVSQHGEVYDAEVLRIMPSSINTLPSKTLTTDGGGGFAPDPRSRDPLESFQRFFQVELRLPDSGPHVIEERVFVRFRHAPEPIGFRWYRAIRRLFLSQLNV